MNYLWAAMMGLGVLWGATHGNMEAVTNAALESAKEAVTLCITMLGILSFWNGMLEIGSRSGLMEKMAEKCSPCLSFLFPDLPKGHPARKEIAVNMIANILGLGWAATPAGLRAMQELERLEEERRAEEGRRNGTSENKIGKRRNKIGRRKKRVLPKGTANNEMCTFLVLNISSLQLLPITMIAYRSQYGSLNPSGIVGAAMLATLVSTAAGVLFCKLMTAWRGTEK